MSPTRGWRQTHGSACSAAHRSGCQCSITTIFQVPTLHPPPTPNPNPYTPPLNPNPNPNNPKPLQTQPSNPNPNPPRPTELEQLVCGGRSLDLEALQSATHYDDGFTASTPVVRWFWEVGWVGVGVGLGRVGLGWVGSGWVGLGSGRGWVGLCFERGVGGLGAGWMVR